MRLLQLNMHPRFRMHFTPTSGSWLNVVEWLFRNIIVNRLRGRVVTSVAELTAAIDGQGAHHATKPAAAAEPPSERSVRM
jgi:hypothetical protein